MLETIEKKHSKVRRNMQGAMLDCNGVQTQIITAGRWVEEGLPPNDNKHLVIVIPGNPGVPEFYKDFIKAINSRLPSETPVWLIGHAGHVQPPKESALAMPGVDKWHVYYGLKGQTDHKINFIKTYVPKDATIHFIGHSIGSWFLLNLLKDEEIGKKVEKCYMLFPTIEHMAATPNGKYLTNFVLHIVSLLIYLSWIITLLPVCLQAFLVRVFGLFYGIPARSVGAVLQLLHPEVLRRVFRLAKEEMKAVQEMDHDTISKHADKLWLYYGSTDGWAPIAYYDNMKVRHPDVEAQLCKRGFQHSFVFKSDKEVGHMVGDLINDSISKAQ